MSERLPGSRETMSGVASRTVRGRAGLEDQAVGRLERDDPRVDLAVARLDQRGPVERRDVEAGGDDRGEQVVAREPARRRRSGRGRAPGAGVAGLAGAGLGRSPRPGRHRPGPSPPPSAARARRRGPPRRPLERRGQGGMRRARTIRRPADRPAAGPAASVPLLGDGERLAPLPAQQRDRPRPQRRLLRLEQEPAEQAEERDQVLGRRVARQPSQGRERGADDLRLARVEAARGTCRGRSGRADRPAGAGSRRAGRSSSQRARRTGRTSSAGSAASRSIKRARPGESRQSSRTSSRKSRAALARDSALQRQRQRRRGSG